MKDFTSKILDIKKIATDTKRFIFSKPENYNFQAGQFLIIKFAKDLMRAYSIASPPSEENLELVIRIIPNGRGTGILDKAKVGDEFTISQAMGHFVLSENQDAELFFLATGTGIAPFKAMIRTEGGEIYPERQTEFQKSEVERNPRKMHLFYGGRQAEDLPYLDEISSWAENLEVKIGLSRDPNAEKIEIPNLQAEIKNCRITKFIKNGNFHLLAGRGAGNSEFYICGNKGMVEGTRDLLLEKGIEKSQIFFEKFN